MIKLAALLFFICAEALGQPAISNPEFSAGGQEGSAGHGYIDEDGNIFLVDLYRTGRHLDPFFGDQDPYPLIQRRVTELFEAREENVELVIQKLTDIVRVHPTLGFSLLLALEKYSWSMGSLPTHERTLLDPALPYDPTKLVTIADRIGGEVLIDNRLYSEMYDDKNRVALLFHEIFDALMRGDERRGRQLNGLIFKPQIQNRGSVDAFARLPVWYETGHPAEKTINFPNYRYLNVGRSGIDFDSSLRIIPRPRSLAGDRLRIEDLTPPLQAKIVASLGCQVNPERLRTVWRHTKVNVVSQTLRIEYSAQFRNYPVEYPTPWLIPTITGRTVTLTGSTEYGSEDACIGNLDRVRRELAQKLKNLVAEYILY